MDIALKRSARYLAFGGVAAIVFGVVVLIWPGLSLVALTYLFGAFALMYGILAVASGLNLAAHGSTEWVPFVLGGLVGVAFGVITLFYPSFTALTLVYFIAIWAIVTGVFRIVAAIDFYGQVGGAVWMGISGVLSIVFGALVALRPGDGALAILWLIALYALISGVTELVAAYRIHEFRSDVKTGVGALRPET